MNVQAALAAIIAALSACLVAAQPVRLFVVEVTYAWGNGTVEKEYHLLLWGSQSRLDVTLSKDALWIMLRVDSTTPYKPYMVAIDGKPVLPRLSRGVVLIEDFVLVNLSLFETKPRVMSFWFREYEPKPPVYTVVDSSDEKKYWGCLIEALLRNTSVVDDVRVKATIIAEKEIRVLSVVGETTFHELVAIVSGDDPEPLLSRLRGGAVELRVTYLYYTERGASAVRRAFSYNNVPSTCGRHEGYEGVLNAIEGLLNSGPLQSRSFNGFHIPAHCPVNVSTDGLFNHVIQGSVVSRGSKASILVPTSTGRFIAQAYRSGVLAYDAEVYGFAPLIRLPEFGFRVSVTVLDCKGEPVENLTAVLQSESNAVRESVPVVKGSCEFERIPPGKYTVRVFLNDLEVGSSVVVVENRDAYVTIKASLVDISIAVVYPSGEKLRNYQFTLSAGGIVRRDYESGGVVRFEDLPPGVYNCTVTRDGALLYSGIVEVEESRNSYVVVANLSKIYVKLVDLLGRPLPNVKVEVKGAASYSAVTGPDGVAYLDLVPGKYTLSITSLGLSRELFIRSGGEYLTLAAVPFETVLVGCATALCAIALAITLKTRRDGVEIMDVEEGAAP